ncbi:protein RD3 isoform X2 [Eucyclogobius newberryi]
MWWWLSWGAEEPYRGPCRAPSEVVCDTLMLELAWQCKEAERMHRERESHFQRLRSGADYSWLVSAPRSTHSLSTGERLGLEDMCSRVPPSHCGLVILKFREAVQAHEPEVQEVSELFRSVLLQTLEQVREEQEAQRLTQQWSSHKRSVSLVNFRSRLRINPFGSTVGLTSAAEGDQQGAGLNNLKTVSQDVERGVDRSQRVWSMPDFQHQSSSSKVL